MEHIAIRRPMWRRGRRLAASLAGVAVVAGAAMTLTPGRAWALPRENCISIQVKYQTYTDMTYYDFGEYAAALGEGQWQMADWWYGHYQSDGQAAGQFLDLYNELGC